PDFALRGEIEHLLAGHRERLVLLDAMQQAPLFGAVQHARLVVLPSLFENISNAVLEAMALGRPVLATSGTGFEEVIEDGVTGFLVPPGDVAALSITLRSCLDRADLDEIGRRAYERVCRFDLDPVARLHVQLFEQVTSGT